ncbi:MAG: potassium transporter TrkA, partial [Gammaproteobacteria bacterium]|nr:potassium transporter TrkA [Gammaproteobacteria bacterium]NDE56093.1 potassium transporter TrkA [Gammaproteobacteria bacterium]
EDSPIVGKTIAELKLREHSGANILVILRGGEVLPNPDDRVTLTAGDQLLALGTSTQLSGLEEQVGPLS